MPREPLNFLLHFHLALADSGDEATALGAMLPDLWRMAAREARARRGLEPLDDRTVRVSRGIEHHFELDAWFHHQPAFAVLEDATTELLAEADAGRSRRLKLFAHVAAEMALDGALIRRDGAPLRASVSAAIGAHADQAALAAEHHHGARRRAAGVDPARFTDRMARLFDAVATFSLPGGYATADGLATRLAGVRASFGMVADPSDLARWAAGFERVAPRADAALVEILERRRLLG
jgi:hypothetical protein